MTNKILLTGFQPFDGETINPSWELVKAFHKRKINNFEIISEEIPTVFNESSKLLNEKIAEHKPQVVICFGQAGGSKTIRLERIAINLDDARIPDNKGYTPVDETIVESGKNAYFTKLPVRKIQETLKKEDIPSSLSLSAGTYVCNHLFYSLLHHISEENIIGGFIHIPYIDEQVKNKKGVFSLNLDTLKKALEIIINTIIEDLNR